MDEHDRDVIRQLTIAAPGSHKGQNGRMLLIGGSALFHAASLWSLTVASRIVDLVHYCSVEENNEIVRQAKSEFRNGIVVSRADVADYIEEDDCILIGPGMTRDEETRRLTDTLLSRYPGKRWVIDAGALQTMDVSRIPPGAVLTPHHGEFSQLLAKHSAIPATGDPRESVRAVAAAHDCTVLLKGEEDIVCGAGVCRTVRGGNPGMTKGGTGDVLAGLVAALACRNDPFIAAVAASAINKQAGDDLYETVGPYFNTSDLATQIPKTMHRLQTDIRE
jgi:hydroxyethylthiazole kinase-like uncharacterized protein yjeF